MNTSTLRDEDGSWVPSTDFDYTEVDRHLGLSEPDPELAECTAEQMEMAIKLLSAVLRWHWRNGSNNPEGVLIRGIIIDWIFLYELRSLTLTKLAEGYGKDKQSIGRWVDNFKANFPYIKTQNMIIHDELERTERASEKHQ